MRVKIPMLIAGDGLISIGALYAGHFLRFGVVENATSQLGLAGSMLDDLLISGL